MTRQSILVLNLRLIRDYKKDVQYTLVISSTTTSSNLSPKDLKVSRRCPVFPWERTVPLTEKPAWRSDLTIHAAMKPFAPVTRTFPLVIAGMLRVSREEYWFERDGVRGMRMISRMEVSLLIPILGIQQGDASLLSVGSLLLSSR